MISAINSTFLSISLHLIRSLCPPNPHPIIQNNIVNPRKITWASSGASCEPCTFAYRIISVCAVRKKNPYFISFTVSARRMVRDPGCSQTLAYRTRCRPFLMWQLITIFKFASYITALSLSNVMKNCKQKLFQMSR